jgi:hypothetical protein
MSEIAFMRGLLGDDMTVSAACAEKVKEILRARLGIY